LPVSFSLWLIFVGTVRNFAMAAFAAVTSAEAVDEHLGFLLRGWDAAPSQRRAGECIEAPRRPRVNCLVDISGSALTTALTCAYSGRISCKGPMHRRRAKPVLHVALTEIREAFDLFQQGRRA